MSKKRSKNRRRNRQRRQRKQPAPVLVTTSLDGLEVSTCALPGVDLSHMQTYMEAHVLLPQDLDFGEMPHPEHVRSAVNVLEAERSTPRRCLEAIVLLGHSPCPEALDALGRYARSGRPFAGLAPIAEAECLDLLARTRGPSRRSLAS